MENTESTKKTFTVVVATSSGSPCNNNNNNNKIFMDQHPTQSTSTSTSTGRVQAAQLSGGGGPEKGEALLFTSVIPSAVGPAVKAPPSPTRSR